MHKRTGMDAIGRAPEANPGRKSSLPMSRR
jgi:hypothetical protein